MLAFKAANVVMAEWICLLDLGCMSHFMLGTRPACFDHFLHPRLSFAFSNTFACGANRWLASQRAVQQS